MDLSLSNALAQMSHYKLDFFLGFWYKLLQVLWLVVLKY